MNIIAFGEILWDVEASRRTPGGAPANVAYHAGQLGARAALISAVGDDEPGRELLRLLDTWGVDRTAVAVLPNAPTGTVRVTLDPAGSASYEIVRPVAWDAIPTPPTPPLTSATVKPDAIVFGTLAQRSEESREALAAVLAALPPATMRVYDVNLRPTAMDAALVRASVDRCDLLKLNDAELPFVAAAMGVAPTEAALFDHLHTRGVRRVAITSGALGSVVSDGQTRSELPAEPIVVADTVGAGDAFTATLVVALLKGSPLDTAHRRALAVAAYVCSQHGATPPLPPELR